MNPSGDAAEQVVRLSLEGVEVAAKITGSAAKEVAALLYAALKNRDKNKIKGKQSLTSMLKSGKELSIFSVKNEDMKRFVADAKRYGVVYCALRNTKDNPSGECEIMVRAEDAAKINRIVENIKIATVTNEEAIRSEVEGGIHETPTEHTAPERSVPERSPDDLLVDEMLDQPKKKPEVTHQNPQAARTTKSRPSEPSSERRARSDEGAVKADRPSVRQELRDIQRQQQRQETEARRREERPTRSNSQKRSPQHRQPERKKKPSKSKER